MNILSSLFCHLSCFACSVLLPPPIRMMREIMRKTASHLNQTTSRKKYGRHGRRHGSQSELPLAPDAPRANAPTPPKKSHLPPFLNAICIYPWPLQATSLSFRTTSDDLFSKVAGRQLSGKPRQVQLMICQVEMASSRFEIFHGGPWGREHGGLP